MPQSAEITSTVTVTPSLHEQKENATFSAQRLSSVPSDLLTMRNLVFLDLSRNRLTRFPGALVAQDLPRIEVLNLQHNLLYMLEDIMALSVAPRLRDLNVNANPLRLVDNRIYFLEALVNSPGCETKVLRMIQKDPTLTAKALEFAVADSIVKKKKDTRTMHLVKKLPRRCGFPVLQRLNAQWITDDDIRAVEAERGRPIEYFIASRNSHQDPEVEIVSERAGPSSVVITEDARRFDGSRMTAKELIKKASRAGAIPNATVIQRFQIDVTSNNIVDAEGDDCEDGDAGGEVPDKNDLVRALLGRVSSTKADVSTVSPPSETPEVPNAEDIPEAAVSMHASWNYPIRTFDSLASEERQYIRLRSRRSVESNLQRDDHFFESSVFLDCVAQAERSRRLTVRAVEVLCPTPSPSSPTALRLSQSAPTLLPQPSNAVSQLQDSLSTKFTKDIDDDAYEKLEKFMKKPPSQLKGVVNERDMQEALSELFLSEHVEQRQRVRQLMAANATHEIDATSRPDPLESMATQLDDSLSRTKLRNAVDLANAMLLTQKQEKRMMQMLIDADARAIEQERAALEQALHCHHLNRIAANDFSATEQAGHAADREWMAKIAKQKTPSPWQARNWRAKEAHRRELDKQRTDDDNNLVSEHDSEQTGADKTAANARFLGNVNGPSNLKRTKSRTRRSPLPVKPRSGRPASASVSTLSTPVVPPSSGTTSKTSSNQLGPASDRFRTIETVEQAARDPLDHVSSRDLLVRCATIRQHADEHVEGLAQYRDRFHENEAAWEAMRQDPINIVRRHLRRKLFQDAQEIQIAGTQLFYSSLFQ